MNAILKMKYQKPKTHTQKCKNEAIHAGEILKKIFMFFVCIFNIWFLIFGLL